jgi:predicted MFS family arabinose efflux permease
MYKFKELVNLYCQPFKTVSTANWLMLVAIFVNAMGHMFLLFLSLYLDKLSLSASAIGSILMCYSIGGLIGGYIGGEVVQRIGMKTIFISLISSSIALVLFIFTENNISRIIIVSILGFCHHSFKPASMYFLVRHTKSSNKAQILGLRRVMINLGISVATVIGGILASKNYHYAFLSESFFSIMACVVLWLGKLKWAHLEVDQEELVPDIDIEDIKLSRKFLSVGLLYLSLFLGVLAFSQLFITYPLYLKDYYGADEITFSRLFTISALIIILIEVPLLSYVRDRSQIVVTAIGGVLHCLGLAMNVLSADIVFAYFAVAIRALGEIMLFPSISNLILSYSPLKYGRTIGLYQVVHSLGMSVGMSIGGMLYTVNEAKTLWYSCASLGPVIVVMLWLAARVRGQATKFL